MELYLLGPLDGREFDIGPKTWLVEHEGEQHTVTYVRIAIGAPTRKRVVWAPAGSDPATVLARLQVYLLDRWLDDA